MQKEVALSIGDPDQQEDSEDSNSIEKGENNGEDEDYVKVEDFAAEAELVTGKLWRLFLRPLLQFLPQSGH